MLLSQSQWYLPCVTLCETSSQRLLKWTVLEWRNLFGRGRLVRMQLYSRIHGHKLRNRWVLFVWPGLVSILAAHSLFFPCPQIICSLGTRDRQISWKSARYAPRFDRALGRGLQHADRHACLMLWTQCIDVQTLTSVPTCHVRTAEPALTGSTDTHAAVHRDTPAPTVKHVSASRHTLSSSP